MGASYSLTVSLGFSGSLGVIGAIIFAGCKGAGCRLMLGGCLLAPPLGKAGIAVGVFG